MAHTIEGLVINIDLNIEDENEKTAFHLACKRNLATVKVILESYEEFGIDIKKQAWFRGETALDLLNSFNRHAHDCVCDFDCQKRPNLIRQLEEEYAKIDDTFYLDILTSVSLIFEGSEDLKCVKSGIRE